MPPNLHSAIGFLLLLVLCWLTGKHKPVPWRLVTGALVLQLLLALLLLKVPAAQQIFLLLNRALLAIEQATTDGTRLVFGYLGGGEPPFRVEDPANLFILGFRSLPLVLVISALSALLFYWRILPTVVRWVAIALRRSLGISGPLGVGSAANIFVGMVEAPLLIRPYLLNLHRGELFAVMVTGMATVAGTVLVLYGSLLASVIPNGLGHVMTASLLSAPAALMAAALYHPWPATMDHTPTPAQDYGSAMDAITQGTVQGLSLLLNIIAMLIVLVALVSLANILLSVLQPLDGEPVSLQRLLGWAFAPLAWLTGIPWRESETAGQLLGTKVILNELIAYLELAALAPGQLSERSNLIIAYALCGFANLGSVGIMIGGLTAMVPERRQEIVSLALPSVWCGLLATLMTGAMVGIVL